MSNSFSSSSCSARNFSHSCLSGRCDKRASAASTSSYLVSGQRLSGGQLRPSCSIRFLNRPIQYFAQIELLSASDFLSQGPAHATPINANTMALLLCGAGEPRICEAKAKGLGCRPPPKNTLEKPCSPFLVLCVVVFRRQIAFIPSPLPGQ